jgi:arginine/lysine/ornithine decarboxylase
MPGHKGRLAAPLSVAAAWDVTEIPGADSLYEASGAIAKLEREYAALYGAAGSFLSAGGATLCIQAMLALACKPGSKLLCGRGLHVAAVNAMALLDIDPVWVYPEPGAGGLYGSVTPGAVRDALEKNPGVSAVYITSPNYYGLICDIPAISAVCREAGIILLVDNAHGAHLRFLPEDIHPIALGADMCCDSLHKTLPVLTGGAMLHIGNPRFLAEAKAKMALFGSTSPSYLIMLSADMALDYLRGGVREDLSRVSERIALISRLAAGRGFTLPEGALDPLRLTVCFAAMGYSREDFAEYLNCEGVEPEFMSGSWCVFLASPVTGDSDFDALERAITRLPRKAPREVEISPLPILKRAVSPREALFAPSESISVERAAGRVVSSYVAPCPPGIPIAVPGEVITDGMENVLKNYGIFTINVLK